RLSVSAAPKMTARPAARQKYTSPNATPSTTVTRYASTMESAGPPAARGDGQVERRGEVRIGHQATEPLQGGLVQPALMQAVRELEAVRGMQQAAGRSARVEVRLRVGRHVDEASAPPRGVRVDAPREVGAGVLQYGEDRSGDLREEIGIGGVRNGGRGQVPAVEVLQQQPSARRQGRREPGNDLAAAREVLQHEPGVDEVPAERGPGRRDGFDIDVVPQQPNAGRRRNVARVEVSSEYLALGPDAFGEPVGDRSAADADLEAVP